VAGGEVLREGCTEAHSYGSVAAAAAAVCYVKA